MKKGWIAKVDRVYYGESEFGGPHGGHCGYQWLCDIGIYRTAVFHPEHVYKKRIPLKFGEPKENDFKKECRIWLKDWMDHEPERQRDAKSQAERLAKLKKMNAIAQRVRVAA